MSKTRLNTSHLSLYLENHKGLLFNHGNCCLYSLPALSVLTLLLIDDGLSQQQVLTTLRDHSGLCNAELLDTYRHISDMFTLQTTLLNYADGQYPELAATSTKKIKVNTENIAQTFQVAQASFLILAEPELIQEITDLLGPVQKVLNYIDFEIQVKQQVNGYCIYSNAILVEQCASYLEVVPLIIDRLQVLAFQKSDYTFCFHGAALATPRGNLLLPGESGAGKSTLSAILLDKTHQLYSDEFIVLTDKFEITTIPLPIAIKSGSWQVVSEKYPQLTQAKIWHRLDGRQLKYLWPSSFAIYSPNPKHNTVLIHPQYSDTVSKSEISDLSIIDTLSLLTTSGYQLGFELNAENLEKLITYIQQTQKMKITYNNGAEVSKVLRSLT